MTIICVALLRGPVVGAVAGFWGGLLLDTANLGTLGVTSLLLTVAGYWIGRYGETTGRDRCARAVRLRRRDHRSCTRSARSRFHYVLGDPAPARAVLWSTLFQAIALNLILTWPVYALARLVLRRAEPPRPSVQRIHAVG